MVSRRTLLKGTAAAPVAVAGTKWMSGASAQDDAIRVGSKDFPESIILGEIIALVLEDAGIAVDRKLNLGGTVIAHESLVNDELDVYPEYTGTGLLVVLESSVDEAMGDDAEADPEEAVYTYVRDQYAEQFELAWLERTPMSNSQALAVTAEFAEENALTTISDLAAASENVDIVISAPVDFEEREDGLLGLQEVYGGFDVPVNGVAPGIKYQALMDGDANVVLAFSTDAEIAFNNLVVLEDDMSLWPPYNVSPVVRQSALDANSDIADLLNGVFPTITNEIMIGLNGQVVGDDGMDPEQVARDFLVEQELIAAG